MPRARSRSLGVALLLAAILMCFAAPAIAREAVPGTPLHSEGRCPGRCGGKTRGICTRHGCAGIIMSGGREGRRTKGSCNKSSLHGNKTSPKATRQESIISPPQIVSPLLLVSLQALGSLYLSKRGSILSFLLRLDIICGSACLKNLGASSMSHLGSMLQHSLIPWW